MSSTKLSLKLFIDRKTNKILFAEAGKETIDFLFGILTLPVARTTSLVPKQGMAGCVANLYLSVEDMNSYVHDYEHKNILLIPNIHTFTQRSSLFKLNNLPEPQNRFYRCSAPVTSNTTIGKYGNTVTDNGHHYVTDNPGNACPKCGMLMNREVPFVGPSLWELQIAKSSGFGGGFVRGMVTYMVMDDLVVKPMSTTSTITMFAKFNIKDVEAIEEKLVYLDADMGLKLLKMSFQSTNVLSSIFLPQENPTAAAVDA